MNFKDNTRHEVLGHTASMRAVTTAAIIKCNELPPQGLLQTMHDPHRPLLVQDIFDSPGVAGDTNGVGVAITSGIIANAIRQLHPSSVDAVFEGCPNQYPSVPVLSTLEATKTQYWQFGAIFEDEGSITGTYGVHSRLFQEQLGLHTPDNPTPSDPDDFSTRLWLAHGDQLTADRIRSVKAEQSTAERTYDRRNWLLGMPAWFHIQMNLLMTIVRTHYAPSGPRQRSIHTLQSDFTTWNRGPYSRDNAKYHLLEPLVVHGFTARVASIFYMFMQADGLLPSDLALESTDSIAELHEAVARLTCTQFNDLVERVRVHAFTLDAWNGCSHQDSEFRTMCRMLQEVEIFLVVKHAIKHGDIGLLRRMVDPLIVVFFGASQWNYGREMLFYRWQLSPVNSQELQDAILASGLVNWPGRPDTFKPVDLGLEHLNANCKIEMQSYKNSTHDVDVVFNRVCLTNTWTRSCRSLLEATFGVYQNPDHTVRSAALDILTLALKLYRDGLNAPRCPSHIDGECFESQDILMDGMSILAERVDLFNQQHVQLHPREDVQIEEARTEESEFIDIDDIDVSAYVAESDAWENFNVEQVDLT